jgi:hypothetical protein
MKFGKNLLQVIEQSDPEWRYIILSTTIIPLELLLNYNFISITLLIIAPFG